MKRSPMPPRKKGIKKRNQKRLAKRRAEEFGKQSEHCRTLPCCACGLWPPSHPHHVRSRAAGGKDGSAVGLCIFCHAEVHQLGRQRFERKHGIDLAEVARSLAEELAGGDL